MTLQPIAAGMTLTQVQRVTPNNGDTVTIPCVYQTFNGVTIAGINVLGSQTIAAAPNGTTVSILVTGTLA